MTKSEKILDAVRKDYIERIPYRDENIFLLKYYRFRDYSKHPLGYGGWMTYQLDGVNYRFWCGDKTAEKLLVGEFTPNPVQCHYTQQVDPEQLRMGIEVELEHTSDRAISEKIARDHLEEIPDYYTRLKKMETEARAEVKAGTI